MTIPNDSALLKRKVMYFSISSGVAAFMGACLFLATALLNDAQVFHLPLIDQPFHWISVTRSLAIAFSLYGYLHYRQVLIHQRKLKIIAPD
jgi:hypothetical protein